jgi:peptidoglycan biosynthesis protein MviN/MurJ (putative lipid II flippase)
VAGELGIAPSTVVMLAIATLAMQCGMLAYAWYGFYAHSKYRHKARWAATVIKITVGTILLGLVKWWLIDLPARF